MSTPIRPLQQPPLDDPAERFHLASRMTRLLSRSYSGRYSFEFVTDAGALARFGTPTSIVDDGAGIALGSPRLSTRSGVARALRSRRSATSFGGASLPRATLEQVLDASVHVTPEHGRGAPSPGALYPLDTIVVVTDVEGIEPGFYGYHPYAHRLVRLGIEHEPRAWLGEALAYQGIAQTCAFHVFLVASFDRVRVKYGQRGYRFLLLEAGHVVQSMLLAAEEAGAASCTIGGFFDDEVDRALGLDGLDVSVVHSAAFGAPGERG